MSTTKPLQVTDRSAVKRNPKRGCYDRATIDQILDEALVIHVGFMAHNQPFVIPMSYGRDGDRLYIHGAVASRMLKNLEQGIEICVSATILDGIVIARSLFHHSMNYRSVMLFGRATLVDDEQEKRHALKILSEHIVPGQWEQARQPTPAEMKATTVLAFPIEEGSAKVRSGDPKDDAADYELPIWAGQLPLKLTPGVPIPDSQLRSDITVPENLLNYHQGA
ncbi:MULTISPECIES: pyridoxamine 5'-phosphate oxidase family protein [unclassified Roseofilum]|uniref:pyridoxamine 5'-phosphate oxidase family protein n=1 Tax=unclassified Roseofilum TaxID=2620099 RepID=UPI000E93DF98|nr:MULTISPECIES: pyridoxamine 5'-phosphate oxidase family protein [unclassified Roseofilum]MBP0008838.1 pyridoxamine 5'-phosphate oxidase family protein [Roseofilum sp. Belize Diploria]MBP0033131.1 pyridoxamine 5'-phosphate oxidase family protein [Roseofilum sp. Belize BBD 4]HBQ97814.1 pyridoxamine 5'-phosphate oxidase family protein [Cyanobacteria bacterium UBA11691]